jgi:hypothetical protein
MKTMRNSESKNIVSFHFFVSLASMSMLRLASRWRRMTNGVITNHRTSSMMTTSQRPTSIDGLSSHRSFGTSGSVPMAALTESFLNGTSAEYVERMNQAWRQNPQSVHVSWQAYFEQVERGKLPGAAHAIPIPLGQSQSRITYRSRSSKHAKLLRVRYFSSSYNEKRQPRECVCMLTTLTRHETSFPSLVLIHHEPTVVCCAHTLRQKKNGRLFFSTFGIFDTSSTVNGDLFNNRFLCDRLIVVETS